jgi:hypothetical protein
MREGRRGLLPGRFPKQKLRLFGPLAWLQRDFDDRSGSEELARWC